MINPFLLLSTLPIITHSEIHAAIIIDTFDMNQTLISGADSSNTASGAGILGGERDSRVQDPFYLFAGQDVGTTTAGTFSLVHFDNPTYATHQLVWDGSDGDATSTDFTGLGGVDLTEAGANNSFEVDVSFASFNSAVSVTWNIYSDAV